MSNWIYDHLTQQLSVTEDEWTLYILWGEIQMAGMTSAITINQRLYLEDVWKEKKDDLRKKTA